MKLDTHRARQLDAYLKDKVPQEHTAVRVELTGKVETLRVFRVPLKYLIFNIRNGRFAAELLEKEEQLRRKLDPTVEQDARIMQTLLLEQSRSETEALKEDLRAHGQLEPGIITFDGAVINANRRMAILKVLFEETREPRFEFLAVARLPQQVDHKDIWRIEAGLQFAKDFRVEYGPVNELLKLKEGLQQGLTADDISKSLLGRYSAKKVNEKLEILRLIDSYLRQIKKPGEYHLIQRNVEKFNSLQANVVAPLRKKGKADARIADTISVAFALIHKAPDITHWDIRSLHKIALNKEAEGELSPILADKASKETIVDAFTVAQEIVEDSEKKDKPERLVKRALRAIKSISPQSSKLTEARVRALLRDLAAQVQLLLKRK
jgi:hypothetical protein